MAGIEEKKRSKRIVSHLNILQKCILLAIVLAIAGIVVTHFNISQLLSNPLIWIAGGAVVGMHILGGSIAAFFMFLARRYRSGGKDSGKQKQRNE